MSASTSCSLHFVKHKKKKTFQVFNFFIKNKTPMSILISGSQSAAMMSIGRVVGAVGSRRAEKKRICEAAKPWFHCSAILTKSDKRGAAKPICCWRLVFVAEGRASWCFAASQFCQDRKNAEQRNSSQNFSAAGEGAPALPCTACVACGLWLWCDPWSRDSRDLFAPFHWSRDLFAPFLTVFYGKVCLLRLLFPFRLSH